MGKKLTWARDFAPCYTPMEMIEAGVFEGIYTGCIKGIPVDILSVLKDGDSR